MPFNNALSILQGKDFPFQPVSPSVGERYQLLWESAAAMAGNRRGTLLVQHFLDYYARGWLYDIAAKQAITLEVVLPQAAAVMIYVLQGDLTLHTGHHHSTRLFEHSHSLFRLQPQQHTLRAAKGHCRLLLLQLTAPLHSLLDESHIVIPLRAHRPGTITAECRRLLNSLHQLHCRGEIWQLKRQVIILDLLFKTFEEIGVGYKESEAAARHSRYDTLQQVKEYIHHNIHKKLSLDVLAGRFAMPPALLRRTYKQVFHHHLTDFIREVRLNKARQLLQHTSLPVHEIAWEVGYESSTSFSRVFSTFYQQSPSDFRKHTARIRPAAAVKSESKPVKPDMIF